MGHKSGVNLGEMQPTPNLVVFFWVFLDISPARQGTLNKPMCVLALVKTEHSFLTLSPLPPASE